MLQCVLRSFKTTSVLKHTVVINHYFFYFLTISCPCFRANAFSCIKMDIEYVDILTVQNLSSILVANIGLIYCLFSSSRERGGDWVFHYVSQLLVSLYYSTENLVKYPSNYILNCIKSHCGNTNLLSLYLILRIKVCKIALGLK